MESSEAKLQPLRHEFPKREISKYTLVYPLFWELSLSVYVWSLANLHPTVPRSLWPHGHSGHIPAPILAPEGARKYPNEIDMNMIGKSRKILLSNVLDELIFFTKDIHELIVNDI